MGFEIEALLLETEGLLQRSLGLAPAHLAPDLARAEGVFRGGPALIETRVYEGPSVRFARFAYVSGAGLEIANILCIGRSPLPLPILGADLVSVSEGSAMFAADLSPVIAGAAPCGARLLDPIARRRALHPELPPGGELPAWCSAWFSPFALYTRFGPSMKSAAAAALLDFPRAFIDIERTAEAMPERAESIEQDQSRYLEDHRTQDKGLSMIAKMFGAAWAARYIEDVLFPQSPPPPRRVPGP